MYENDPGKTDKLTATENKPLSPLSEVEDEKKAQRELDPLQNNQLEDIGNKSGTRGHKVTKEYSAGPPVQLSKVSVEQKTWWDWSQILIIPLLLLLLGSAFTLAQYIASLQIAHDQQQETILRTYLDDMSNLLLTQHLSTSKPGEPVREVARERTLTTLRRLDADRNKIVLRFLQDAHLIGIQDAVINLSNADLSNVDLNDIDLSGIDLSGDILNGAHLHGADLYEDHLNNADLSGADLGGADLSEALLSNATLRDAHLRGAFLGGANLNAAILYSADLSGADLSNADLNGADLSNATLSDATLSDVDLSEARDLIQPQLDTVSSCTIGLSVRF